VYFLECTVVQCKDALSIYWNRHGHECSRIWKLSANFTLIQCIKIVLNCHHLFLFWICIFVDFYKNDLLFVHIVCSVLNTVWLFAFIMTDCSLFLPWLCIVSQLLLEQNIWQAWSLVFLPTKVSVLLKIIFFIRLVSEMDSMLHLYTFIFHVYLLSYFSWIIKQCIY
jgi:hypothetical protein